MQLTVRPSVNAGGLVTLDVLQTVTDVGKLMSPAIDAFSSEVLKAGSRCARVSRLSWAVSFEKTAANNENGVPWLHKAPIIGPLFGTTEKTRDRTELLVILTPRALYNDEELRQASDEMRDQIRDFELIEQ